MPYHLSRAALVAAMLLVCLCLSACHSNLPTQSTLVVVVHDQQLAGLIPQLKKNGASVRALGKDGWEIRNDADSRQAIEAMLGEMDRAISTQRDRIAAAYEQQLVPGGHSRYANQCLHSLRDAHDQRDRVAAVLEQMDPARLGTSDSRPVRLPDGGWRPVAAWYDARLPLRRPCPTDELIEQAAIEPMQTNTGRRLVTRSAGAPVASR
ncbi:MAG: hypothetical protein ACOCVI_01105 [Planctomycetota bacterium]